MKLHWSPRSPFVRKVMIVAHEAGLADRLTEQIRHRGDDGSCQYIGRTAGRIRIDERDRSVWVGFGADRQGPSAY